MGNSTGSKRTGYKNFLLNIFDAWLLFNEELPNKIEEEKRKEEIKEERRRKLDPTTVEKDNFFSQTELPIIKELASNPRISFLELANNLGVSRRTVRKRIEKMLAMEKFQFTIGVNYKRLNLDLMLVNLNGVNLKYLSEIELELENCPRIFWIAKDISKSNIHFLFGTEKNHHHYYYMNIIEKLQLDSRVKECRVTSLNPELTPKFLIFSKKQFPETSRRAPCGSNCSLCDKFIDQKCTGCPVFEGYSGNFFKMNEK